MGAALVLRRMLRDRARSLTWWTLAVVALTFVVAASYPAVKDAASAMEQFVEMMPEGMLEAMGAEAGITSPEGYLNSQFYSNIFPIVLLVLGIGAAAWTIAGAERDGTLEPLLANPVSRSRVALERFIGVAVLVAVPTLAAMLVLIVTRSPFEFEALGAELLVATSVASYLLVMVFVTLTFAVGAATGSKAAAIAVGAGLAAATYVVFALAGFVEFFENLRWLSPWHWFLDNSPLNLGWTWPAIGWPLLVVVPAVIVGTVVFTRRDLR